MSPDLNIVTLLSVKCRSTPNLNSDNEISCMYDLELSKNEVTGTATIKISNISVLQGMDTWTDKVYELTDAISFDAIEMGMGAEIVETIVSTVERDNPVDLYLPLFLGGADGITRVIAPCKIYKSKGNYANLMVEVPGITKTGECKQYVGRWLMEVGPISVNSSLVSIRNMISAVIGNEIRSYTDSDISTLYNLCVEPKHKLKNYMTRNEITNTELVELLFLGYCRKCSAIMSSFNKDIPRD